MSISPIRWANRRSRNWSIGVPQCRDCPSQVFSTATKIVTTAKTKFESTKHVRPSAERRKGLHRSAALDYLQRRIENVPPNGAPGQMRRCDYLVHCEPSDAEEDQPRQLQAGSCDDGFDGLGNNRRHPRRDEMLSRSR